MRSGAGDKGTVDIEQYQAFGPTQLCVPFFGFGGDRRRSSRFSSCLLNSFFKRLDALPQALTQFRKLLRSEDEERDGKDNQQMLGLQQTFNHGLEKLLNLTYIVRDAGRLRIGYQKAIFSVPSTLYDRGQRNYHDWR